MTIQLRCLDKELRGQVWTMELDPERVVIRDASKNVLREISSQDVMQQFKMPSFSESIKHFGIWFDKKLRSFDVSKEDLKRIKDYRNCLTAVSGPAAVNKVRNLAIASLVFGLVIAVSGVTVTVISIQMAAADPAKPQFKITFGAILFGLIMIGKGIHGLFQYRQQRQIREQLSLNQ